MAATQAQPSLQAWPPPAFAFGNATDWTVSSYWAEYVQHVQPLDVACGREWRSCKKIGVVAADKLKKDYSHRSQIWRAVKECAAEHGLSEECAALKIQGILKAGRIGIKYFIAKGCNYHK